MRDSFESKYIFVLFKQIGSVFVLQLKPKAA